MRAVPRHLAIALLPLLLCQGCLLWGEAPIGVKRMDPDAVHRALVRSALSGRELSRYTQNVLMRSGYADEWRSDPAGLLAFAHTQIFWPRPGPALFGLAELSFLHAQRTDDRAHYIAAAIYAYAFLFPDPGENREPPEPFDPRLRIASDIYNRSLIGGLRYSESDALLDPAVRSVALPFGTLEIDFDPEELVWDRYRLTGFQPAADLGVRGLRNRYRQPGIGAPLVAATEPRFDLSESAVRVPPAARVPVTAVLRFENALGGIRTGRLRGRFNLYTADKDEGIEIGGRRVPLEFETTAALATTLAASRFWETETGRFFGTLGFEPGDPWGDGLVMLAPYDPERIPVVLVHGTASSPGRWAELANELTGDNLLRDLCQIWLFSYETGQPISYSAGLLRESLQNVVDELDPQGDDENLRNMVVIGHSQGGLLTKLTAVDSGDRFWRFDTPLEELELTPPQKHMLRRSLFFEPLPSVSRVVFIATPHRGSFLATWNASKLVRNMVRLPGDITNLMGDVIEQNPDAFDHFALEEIPSSVDGMTPDNEFLNTLLDLPIADGVSAHSIIAVQGDGPIDTGNDGVVEYQSAHLEGVRTELVVRSGHSTQSNPFTMREVKRILITHLVESTFARLDAEAAEAAAAESPAR